MSQEKSIVKYLVKLRFEVDGIVEKADLIGAIFGQTEGLFGPEMNLQELQKTWKVGRIEINLQSTNGRTTGEVLIPMSTDVSTCALIAAAVENVDKVGPCSAKFTLLGINDVRADRRKVIVDRAKEIMKDWASKTTSEGEESLKTITDSTKRGRVLSYGAENLPAGPAIDSADTLYVVEGRADIINLMRAGIENTIAVEGTSIPDTVKELGKRRTLLAFLDGDRGGDLILKELTQVARIERVYRAPRGREVEELTPVEILEIVRGEESPREEREDRRERYDRERYPRRDRGDRRGRGQREDRYREERRHNEEEPREQLPPPPPLDSSVSDKVKEDYSSINGTLEAVVYDNELKETVRFPVNELVNKIGDVKGSKLLVFDGIVTQRLVDASSKVGVSTIVGHRAGDIRNKPSELNIYSFKDLGLE
ncbi:MAG TPA: DNA primase DnaG [Nitrososphaerales archaeon]|nr:DNA primase DnaG [Nitrososphaerales archaeon]